MCSHGGHDHDCASHAAQFVHTEGDQYNMFAYIVREQVVALNEAVPGSGPAIFRPYSDRLQKTPFLESDADEELLIYVPFSGHVKLTGMCLIGDDDESHPARVRLFKDREQMSFDDCAVAADQEIDLKQDTMGTVDYPLKVNRFGNVSSLTIHIDRNFGGETSRVFYIGLRGEFLGQFRDRVVVAAYEARALPGDHKGEIPEGNHSHVM